MHIPPVRIYLSLEEYTLGGHRLNMKAFWKERRINEYSALLNAFPTSDRYFLHEEYIPDLQLQARHVDVDWCRDS